MAATVQIADYIVTLCYPGGFRTTHSVNHCTATEALDVADSLAASASLVAGEQVGYRLRKVGESRVAPVV